MARDVTWRSVKRPRLRHQARNQLLILGALLIANAAVVLYHGDPRDSVAALSTSTGDKERTTASEAIEDNQASSEQSSRVDTAATDAPYFSQSTETPPLELDLPGVPAVSTSLDPLAGMRTPGRIQRVAVLALERGQTVAAAVIDAGARDEEVAGALESLKGLVNFRRLQPGQTLKARFDIDGTLVSLEVHASKIERFRTDFDAGAWSARPVEVHVDTVLANVSGIIESSLWDALIGGGERPQLVTDIVDVFAWDIDFYREVYPGDTFRVLVEKRYVDGRLLDYGPVHAAEFVSDGMPHRGYRFQRADGGVAYYDAEGRSLRKQLLKSPMQYGAVTSGFGRRRHPVLGFTRAHNGVDYGVPTGTPVWTVGDGRVLKAGWNGGFGRYVEIRHANNWRSQYAHLSKILVKAGQRVGQKEVIGKVGTTGLSTGPHLHFGLKRNGKYVNPSTQKFERGKPLTGDDLEKFGTEVERLTSALEEMRVARDGAPSTIQEG
ncbi:MAG: M23 family metallopeptidase [Myxococcota bacterium]